jgi:hypothetical protein
VRDRMTWAAIEPQRGQFAEHTKYDDTARIFHEAGLHVLQVAHQSPPWANPSAIRFPLDLRDAYNFYRDIAKRWKGEVDAFEPWNEAEGAGFGGHMGSEMAAMQKASYLGIKAGNPDAIACLNVFAQDLAPILGDFSANHAEGYFDTYNLHHYMAIDAYPTVYTHHRLISDGKPMWVTEFNMPVKWSGDAKLQEPSDKDLKTQAEIVPKVFAGSLNQGPSAAFYFILGHYVEGQTQFGVLHRDLTPRPAYCALAAVGRLLADAKPLGSLPRNPKNLRAFAFRAMPDGEARDVIVAWAAQGNVDLKLPANPPVKPIAIFDHLGRNLPVTASPHISSPVFIVMPENATKSMPFQPAQAAPAPSNTKLSPIVLQQLADPQQIAPGLSAMKLETGRDASLPIFAYNFSDHPAHLTLSASAPDGTHITVPDSIDIPPGERIQIPTTVNIHPTSFASVRIRITADAGADGKPVLSFNLAPVNGAARKP